MKRDEPDLREHKGQLTSGGMCRTGDQLSNDSSIVQPERRLSMNLADAPDVLTLEEARELLRMGRNRIYALVRSGKLPRLPGYGRRIMIARMDLQRWLQDQSRGE
jgi:excisionase family DNA binding protein